MSAYAIAHASTDADQAQSAHRDHAGQEAYGRADAHDRQEALRAHAAALVQPWNHHFCWRNTPSSASSTVGALELERLRICTRSRLHMR